MWNNYFLFDTTTSGCGTAVCVPALFSDLYNYIGYMGLLVLP